MKVRGVPASPHTPGGTLGGAACRPTVGVCGRVMKQRTVLGGPAMGTAADPWRMYAEERADIHDFLASRSSEQWAVPSLCAGWEVKDVAVHLLVDEPLRQLGVPRALIMAAQCQFSVHRMNQWWVERNRGVPTDSILAFLRRAVAAGTDQ